MEFNGRGFYNTLKFSSSKQAESWQIEDLSTLEIPSIFERLKKLGIQVTQESFTHFVNQTESPEELADVLSEEEDPKSYEMIYLLVFELWKRLAKNKETLSIFCDRLDHLIFSYEDQAEVVDDLVNSLSELQKIFESLNTQGLSYKECYEHISSFMAQDLEAFIYDFISDLIASGENTKAFDLLFGLYDFMHDKLKFDMLKVSLNILENPEETESVFDNVIEKLFEKKKHGVIVDAIYFASDAGLLKKSANLAKLLLEKTSGDEKEEIRSLLDPILNP
jgi:predicted CopG family antitoxin